MAKQTDITDRQLANMNQQLDDFENAQAAELVIDISLSHKIVSPYFICDGTATVRNVGPTVAKDINWEIGGGDAASIGHPIPRPADTGIALGTGSSFVRPITCSGSPADQVLSHQYVVMWSMAVSYRDIFNRPRVTTACRWWDQDADDFEACVDYDPSYRKIPK